MPPRLHIASAAFGVKRVAEPALEQAMPTPPFRDPSFMGPAPATCTAEASVPDAARMSRLQSTHRSLIAALRHDYYSNGRGHSQSKPIATGRKPTPPREAAAATRRATDDAVDAVDAVDEADAHDAPTMLRADEDPALLEPVAQAIAFEAAPEPASAAGADIATRYLAEVATRRRLSSSEEYHLARRASEGDLPSRQHLIEHHLGLVVMIAKRYANRGMPLLDLIEEGNLGLITASTKFDPELGHRFSTYAKWWVRQQIELALMTQLRMVRLPIHLTRSLKQAARKQKEAQRQTGDAAHAGDGLGAEMVALLDGDDREGDQLIDDLPAADDASPEALLASDQQGLQLRHMLAELSRKEQRVIEARYGLGRAEPRTLDDIAQELQLSCERIRQIEKEAVQKLRGLFDDRGIGLDTLLS
jgi:RNA polymerase nonessential primary-like sigma factor